MYHAIHHVMAIKNHVENADTLKNPSKTAKTPTEAGAMHYKKTQLNAKRRPAAAGTLHGSILKLEPGCLQSLDIIHLAIA